MSQFSKEAVAFLAARSISGMERVNGVGLRYSIALISLVAIPLQADPYPLQAQTVAIRLGGVRATFADSESNQFGSRSGLWGGVGIGFPLTGPVYFRVGLDYVQKGATDDRGDLGYRTRVGYLEFPAIVRVRSPRAGVLSSHVLVGAAPSIMTNCGATRVLLFLSEDRTPVNCGDADVTPPRVGLDGVAGVGLRVEASGSFAMTLDLLLSHGFRDVTRSEVESGNRAIGLLVGIEWPWQ